MPAVQKWGNSLGIRVPKAVADRARLEEGTEIGFDVSAGVLTIRPKQRRKHTLASLLAKAKGPSPHRRLDADAPRGRELL